MSMCRQADGCSGRVEEVIQGTNGRAITSSGRACLEGGSDWVFAGDNPNPYRVEHQNLHASIRGERQRLNEAQRIAESTLTAIMGRMAAYSGRDITWEEALGSQQDLSPSIYDFVDMEIPSIPRPGKTPPHDSLWPAAQTENDQ